MNFDLTPEQEAFRGVVREFAEEVVAPRSAEADREEKFPLDVVKQMGELGLFGLPFPEVYGGSDADAVTVCLALEELGRVDQSVAITLSAAIGLAGNLLNRFGTDEQKERWLAPLARGEALGGFALTEPGAGSDAAEVHTTGRLRERRVGRRRLEGVHHELRHARSPRSTSSPRRPSRRAGRTASRRSSCRRTRPGSRPPRRTASSGGARATRTSSSFRGLPRPAGEPARRARARVLAVPRGPRRTGGSASPRSSVGLAQACLDESVTYALEREAFGKPIGGLQAIQFKIADMRAKVESARLLDVPRGVAEGSGARLRARPRRSRSSWRARRRSTARARRSRSTAAYGFIEDFPVARFYRDAKVLEIGEGTSEIHRLILARDLGLPETF